MSNYHWYLKQSYNFSLENKITSVCWDPEDSFKYIFKNMKKFPYRIEKILKNLNIYNIYASFMILLLKKVKKVFFSYLI